MVAHMVKNSSFYTQRKFYYIYRNIFIFRVNFGFLNFDIQRNFYRVIKKIKK